MMGGEVANAGRDASGYGISPSGCIRPAAKRRWGYFALPILHDDRLVGKVDATADRKASVLRVHAIHEDVKFTRTIIKAVQAELDDLASWLGLSTVDA